MGAINLSRIQLVTTVSEAVGYKSGLGLNREQLLDLSDPGYHDYLHGDDEDWVRIRSEDYEDLTHSLLYAVGNTPRRRLLLPGLRQRREARGDPEKLALLDGLLPIMVDKVGEALDEAAKSGAKTLDPTPFVDAATEQYGKQGALLALEMLDDWILLQHATPWWHYRQFEWQDIAELEALFADESLEPLYGRFIDQRYIDYLHRNFDDIDRINWRKFEGLTAEFFEKAGLGVEVGPGRGDDGVDVRVWDEGTDLDGPPTMIIQCKRQQRKIEKVVVKALWADVVNENAGVGMVVTTSVLSPGAEAVKTARSYPVVATERETLRKWITVMRTPDQGIFLGR